MAWFPEASCSWEVDGLKGEKCWVYKKRHKVLYLIVYSPCSCFVMFFFSTCITGRLAISHILKPSKTVWHRCFWPTHRGIISISEKGTPFCGRLHKISRTLDCIVAVTLCMIVGQSVRSQVRACVFLDRWHWQDWFKTEYAFFGPHQH